MILVDFMTCYIYLYILCTEILYLTFLKKTFWYYFLWISLSLLYVNVLAVQNSSKASFILVHWKKSVLICSSQSPGRQEVGKGSVYHFQTWCFKLFLSASKAIFFSNSDRNNLNNSHSKLWINLSGQFSENHCDCLRNERFWIFRCEYEAWF